MKDYWTKDTPAHAEPIQEPANFKIPTHDHDVDASASGRGDCNEPLSPAKRLLNEHGLVHNHLLLERLKQPISAPQI